jgi:uncharacterized membrane protein
MPARAMGHAILAGVAGFCVSGTFLSQGFTWSIYVLLALGTAVSEYAKRKEWLTHNADAKAFPLPNAPRPGPKRPISPGGASPYAAPRMSRPGTASANGSKTR